MSKKNKGIIIGLSIVFITIAILVKFGLLDKIDYSIYNAINKMESTTLDNIFKSVTFLGSTAFIVSLTVVVFIIFIILKDKNKSIFVASSIIISTIFNNVVKLIINRPRPLYMAKVIEGTKSFPSGHTMAATTLYGVLIYVLLKCNINKTVKKILITILILLPIIVGFSRIYLGAHFTSDVLGGMILSTLLLFIEIYIVEKKGFIK